MWRNDLGETADATSRRQWSIKAALWTPLFNGYGNIVATMPEVETEAPPAYSPYESDVTTSQTGADTDSSNLTSHIDVTIILARDTYRSCVKYLESFHVVAHDVAALFSLLEVMKESIADHGVRLNYGIVESTTKLLSASKNRMLNIQTFVTKYEDLPTASQRVWLRSMGGAEELVSLRDQVRKNIDSFGALNKIISGTSQKGVLAKVRKFIAEVRTGQRRSVVSKIGASSLDVYDFTTRSQIQQELDDVGITSHLFDQFQTLIFQTLTGSTETGLQQTLTGSTEKGLQQTPLGITEKHLPQATPLGESQVTKTLPGIKITSNPFEYSQSSNPPKSSTPSGTKYDLFRAISNDDLSRVQQLLDEGLDIESRDDNGGRTPLIVAVGYDKVDIAELLLLSGCDANAKTTNSEETALISACASGRSQIVLLILEHGNPNLEARDRNGRTALMKASAQGYERQVQVLVKAGANIEARDWKGRTALMEAERFGHDQIVSLLTEFGAKRKE
ncbi:hypothetical protein O988_01847 [Pseudogymnoascus sp. VKM F-3808]|nr:hypothetical protein O988_01847 [Pseudogymnoascus sp. VKM F-3808]